MSHRPTRFAAWLLPLWMASGCASQLTARPPLETVAAAAPGAPVLAPSFSLPGDDGVIVRLDDLVANGRPAVLVFYRGYW